jgi:peptidoglycan/xylan/chitin deacetylase (PgdA/CDA1 family)
MEQLLSDVAPFRRSSEFMMRPEHLRDLARAGMTIGSHMVSRPILSEIDEGEVFSELIRSGGDLEAVTGKPVRHIAYPNGPGVPFNFNDTVQRLTREAGYRSASPSIAPSFVTTREI